MKKIEKDGKDRAKDEKDEALAFEYEALSSYTQYLLYILLVGYFIKAEFTLNAIMLFSVVIVVLAVSVHFLAQHDILFKNDDTGGALTYAISAIAISFGLLSIVSQVERCIREENCNIHYGRRGSFSVSVDHAMDVKKSDTADENGQ